MKRFLILLIVLYTGIASASIDPNLVAWWQFDEMAGTIAYDSADSHNGQLINGPVWTTGQIDGGLNFDGVDDYVSVADDASLRFTKDSSFTICAWAKPISTPYYGAIVCKMQANSQTGLFTYELKWHPILQRFDFIPSNSGYYYIIVSTPDGSAPAGNWYYATAVYQNKDIKIYLNGELKNTGYFNSNPTEAADKFLSIGVRTYDSLFEDHFGGTLDDVRIYNRALSAEEIWQLYESALPELTGLDITGPDKVAENSTVVYEAIAHYDDGTAKDVTSLAEWQVEPETIADINNGQMTTGQLLYPEENIEIYAEYTENQVDVGAQKQVSILAICPQGSALKFDGLNDFVSIPNSSSNQISTNQISISAWIKLNNNVGNTQRRIICKQQDNPICWGFQIFGKGYSSSTGNQLVFHDSSGTSYYNCISQTHLVTGQWYHVAVTDNAGQIRIYINGSLDKSCDSGYGILSNIIAPIMIGRTNPDSSFFFDGIIDEVSVFNRALSAGEIKDLMFTKLTGSEPDLIAYWDFDEGTGQTAFDVSGHGNDGALGSTSGPDISDPCWLESDAPVPCTTEQMIARNLGRAICNKELANDLLTDAQTKEQASANMIDDLKKELRGREAIDAMKAKRQINVAILHENLASQQIDGTIDRLEGALWLLSDATDPDERPPFWFWPGWFNYQPPSVYGPSK